MNTAVIIQVTVLDTDTHEVERQIAKYYDGSYGYEVESIFSNMGLAVAKIIEPDT